jgi:hypothetical protein
LAPEVETNSTPSTVQQPFDKAHKASLTRAVDISADLSLPHLTTNVNPPKPSFQTPETFLQQIVIDYVNIHWSIGKEVTMKLFLIDKAINIMNCLYRPNNDLVPSSIERNSQLYSWAITTVSLVRIRTTIISQTLYCFQGT